jgi:hypothetical protein
MSAQNAPDNDRVNSPSGRRTPKWREWTIMSVSIVSVASCFILRSPHDGWSRVVRLLCLVPACLMYLSFDPTDRGAANRAITMLLIIIVVIRLQSEVTVEYCSVSTSSSAANSSEVTYWRPRRCTGYVINPTSASDNTTSTAG